MKPYVVITKKIPQHVETFIADHCRYIKWEDQGTMPMDMILEHLPKADGLLTASHTINEQLLAHAPQLKVVSTLSVGYNHFDIEAMRARKVLGTNTPGVLNETVADLIFSLMLATARRIPEIDQYIRQGKWTSSLPESMFGLDVHHKTLGIIGMGGIGEAVAHRAKWGFDMNILYHNRSRKPELEDKLDAKYCTLEKLLAEADFIVIMTPLTKQTYHLIGKKQFALMKPTSIFINASRGATVDEDALVEALQNKQIYAAGLDVFKQEPIDPNHPLLTLPNVVLLPHIGSATQETRDAMALLAAQNLVTALQGECPPNLVKELFDLIELQ
ncbi:gluconate 2-dehydrogenase [Paenibacillus turicensis]|uniref:Gluconate 2-dehydrogenase n=1 Tax=Paenibacillus turicensis TaxID=160487 RepID=A0ABS4FRC9_9BACL|nr:D-glycerate dehydrogenase [Paenibacillus turicensis]MBP1905120.1 gluconate 2-dehydrogenase [Paenibacillus turicensis]